MKRIITFIAVIISITRLASAQDSMYIYKSGVIVGVKSLNEMDLLLASDMLNVIDSIVFEQPPIAKYRMPLEEPQPQLQSQPAPQPQPLPQTSYDYMSQMWSQEDVFKRMPAYIVPAPVPTYYVRWSAYMEWSIGLWSGPDVPSGTPGFVGIYQIQMENYYNWLSKYNKYYYQTGVKRPAPLPD